MESSKFKKILDLEGVELATEFELGEAAKEIPELDIKFTTKTVETVIRKIKPLKPYEILWCLVECNYESMKVLLKVFKKQLYEPNSQYDAQEPGKHYYVDFVEKTFFRLNEMEDFFVTRGRNMKMTAENAIEHHEKWKHVFSVKRFGI